MTGTARAKTVKGVQAAIRDCRHLRVGVCYLCAEKLVAEQTVALERQIALQDASIARLREERDVAREQTTALRAMVKEHGRHEEGCSASPWRQGDGGLCNCWMSRALLAEAEGQRAQP